MSTLQHTKQYEGKTLRSKGPLYDALIRMQGGEFCAICFRTVGASDGRKLHIDHDHTCCPKGKYCWRCVRGLLCASCNITVHTLEHAVAVLNYLSADRRLDDSDR